MGSCLSVGGYGGVYAIWRRVPWRLYCCHVIEKKSALAEASLVWPLGGSATQISTALDVLEGNDCYAAN